MKQNIAKADDNAELVAPHTGAWIETMLHAHKTHKEIVAPHTGAWIETAQGYPMPLLR